MTTAPTNLFEPPGTLDAELVQLLLRGRGPVRIERIVSQGHASSPGFWYDQEEDEWVTLLRGEARLEFTDEPPLQMKPGDHVLIRAHRRHRVAWTAPGEDTVWLALFLGHAEEPPPLQTLGEPSQGRGP